MSHPHRLGLTGLVALVLAGCSPDDRGPMPWERARDAPLVSWPVIDAAAAGRWAAASAQPVVASLWARWCAPCLEEMPTLARLSTATGAAWIAIATDDPADRPEATREALRPVGQGLLHARAAGGPEAFLASVGARWTGVLPIHALFAADGRFLGVIEGVLAAEDADRLTHRLGGAP